MKAALAVLLTALSMTVSHARTADAPPPATIDHRPLVEMPEQARALMRQDMLMHLASLNSLLGLLAAGDMAEAAEVAETELGLSSMGKHRATGMGPGRFMPPEMRQLGWTMHQAASEFARVAREGNAAASYAALQQVTSACVACHMSYRTY